MCVTCADRWQTIELRQTFFADVCNTSAQRLHPSLGPECVCASSHLTRTRVLLVLLTTVIFAQICIHIQNSLNAKFCMKAHPKRRSHSSCSTALAAHVSSDSLWLPGEMIQMRFVGCLADGGGREGRRGQCVCVSVCYVYSTRTGLIFHRAAGDERFVCTLTT